MFDGLKNVWGLLKEEFGWIGAFIISAVFIFIFLFLGILLGSL